MTVHVVVGGQFGSEAKGHVTHWLVRQYTHSDNDDVLNVRTGGPNAGHTVYPEGSAVPFKLRQLPVGVVEPRCKLALAAGSEIDPEVLQAEIVDAEAAGFQVKDRFWVDPEITLIETWHKSQEAEMTARLGSTAKGIGAARSDRIMRIARRVVDAHLDEGLGLQTENVGQLIRQHMAGKRAVTIIEGTQGHGLGLHAGYYPYCTSGDVDTPHQLAACGINGFEFEIVPWVVLRTYPIRVAGNSGPMVSEIDFAILSKRMGQTVEPERTTVTNKVRRIGEWDADLAKSAVSANGGQNARIALMFADYWYPDLKGARTIANHHPIFSRIAQVEDQCGAYVHLLGTGPTSMVQLRSV